MRLIYFQKEYIKPTNANSVLFYLAPILSVTTAIAAAVIPVAPGFVVADVDAGMLYIFAVTSLGAYAIIIAGWSSNSKNTLCLEQCVLWHKLFHTKLQWGSH